MRARHWRSWTLIYLNAAIESWQNGQGRFPDAGGLKLNNELASRRSLTRTPQSDRKVSTMAGTIYLLILIVAFLGIVIWVFDRRRKARLEANARIPLDNDKGSLE